MILSSIQEIIERSIFEKIRGVLVATGYLPDIVNYPDTPEGYYDYRSSIKEIIETKGFCVELFNQGPNTEKGLKKVPRIVIKTVSALPGDLGGSFGKYFVKNTGGTFDEITTPPQSVDFYVNFHLVSGTVEQYRILNSILTLAIPRRSYIDWYTNSGEDKRTFFCRYLNYHDIDNLPTGVMEKVYAYEIPDCYDLTMAVMGTDIPSISDITLIPSLQKYMDDDWP